MRCFIRVIFVIILFHHIALQYNTKSYMATPSQTPTLSTITTLLTKILENQESFNHRLSSIETQLKTLHSGSNKPRRIKKSAKMETIETHSQAQLIDFKTIQLIPITHNHLEVVFFSSLEFAFLIVLLESIASSIKCNNTSNHHEMPTKSVYDEAEHCDAHYKIDVETQLITLADKLHSYKPVFPFKYLNTFDADKAANPKRSSRYDCSKMRCYYDGEWGSSTFKNHLLCLYHRFSNAIIKQFAQWQDDYEDEIEADKLHKGLNYTECVLKILGVGAEHNSTASLNAICNYLCQLC